MNNKWFKWGACIIVLLFLLFIKLPVIQFDFGQEIYYLKSDAFHLKWIHSVEKEEWVEIYQRHKDEIILTETYFKTFGAGVPADGEIIESEDGYVHMRIDRQMADFNLIVSENAQTKLVTEEAEIALYELTDEYGNISISVEYIHLWEYVGGSYL
ncbi:DUF1850 domain-containing protein [Virgibacillus sp. C22-A2]|uniref:DUF1850 domain-containing protein n=1 Tax=Virgibacillus tibetensis TaxID=3042313 RepID=A0ABU6KHK2_9BACI|nr:DUF1850 domain-containing protein [Virgibacillus sp. C22-A2]